MKVNLNATVPYDLKMKLVEQAEKENKNNSDLVTEALKRYLNQKEFEQAVEENRKEVD